MSAPKLTDKPAETLPVQRILKEVSRRIVGQDAMVERLLVGLLTGGHILLEGVPGLAKTLAVRTLAEIIHASFSRIQFTPDLLPADVIGTRSTTRRPRSSTSRRGRSSPTSSWPTRSTARRPRCRRRCSRRCRSTRSPSAAPRIALTSRSWCSPPRIRSSRRAPIRCPKRSSTASCSRCGSAIPARDEEKEILLRMSGGQEIPVERLLEPGAILAARAAIAELYMDEKVVDYIVDLVRATRDPGSVGLARAQAARSRSAPRPRASIALAQAARAHAFLRGRAYVMPEDVQALAPDVLRHRIVLTFEAEAEDVTSDDVVTKVLGALRGAVRISARTDRPDRTSPPKS